MTMRALPKDQSTDTPFHTDYRQQLSALMDGELEADQARFLLRRISHDEALAACQERWQLMGDVLRGQATALAPAGFSAQVQRALENESAVQPKTKSRWKLWRAGMALAASIAAVSVLLVTRTSFLATPSAAQTALSVDISSNTSSPALAVSPDISVLTTPADPFALAPEPSAKPWPRSSLPSASGTFNARALSANEAFYPFTPLTPSSDSPDSRFPP